MIVQTMAKPMRDVTHPLTIIYNIIIAPNDLEADVQAIGHSITIRTN